MTHSRPEQRPRTVAEGFVALPPFFHKEIHMLHIKRAILVVISGVLLGAGLTAGAGAGDAAPQQLPRWSNLFTDDFGTFGDHAGCHGALRVGLTGVPHKRGVVRATFTSLGFTGNGAGWRRDPNCRMRVGVAFTGSGGYAVYKLFPASFGRKPGQRVVHDVRTGSGLVVLSAATYQLKSRLPVPQSYGINYYVIVP
ncbi:enoyl-CoA hydratase [Gordonia sp. ABSL1-1]|uniref:enoyl-CoA hydratase n=1 Tax=Gordonia sp. ABSL1-1 TaxID=3053923 RepID=UPI002572D933|nr:enoyl-CoA hydratase [Gordonia sp. ABSL1-1]MDL9936486.1 enoyl-CoA hydratase [Gordonia sp. ABSL1-1]